MGMIEKRKAFGALRRLPLDTLLLPEISLIKFNDTSSTHPMIVHGVL